MYSNDGLLVNRSISFCFGFKYEYSILGNRKENNEFFD